MRTVDFISPSDYMYMGVPSIYGGHPTTMSRSPVDLVQGSVTCVHAHSLPLHIAGGALYTHAPAYHFGGEGEGARVAQIFPRSEVPTLGEDFYQVVAPARRQHFSHMIFLLMPTRVVIPSMISGISKAYTTLLPFLILEGRGND